MSAAFLFFHTIHEFVHTAKPHKHHIFGLSEHLRTLPELSHISAPASAWQPCPRQACFVALELLPFRVAGSPRQACFVALLLCPFRGQPPPLSVFPFPPSRSGFPPFLFSSIPRPCGREIRPDYDPLNGGEEDKAIAFSAAPQLCGEKKRLFFASQAASLSALLLCRAAAAARAGRGSFL